MKHPAAMQDEPKVAARLSVALTVLLVGALTGGVVFRIVTMRGPTWFFYAISAGVLALVAIDLWDKLRDARVRLRTAASGHETSTGPESLPSRPDELGTVRSLSQGQCRTTGRACEQPLGLMSCPYLLD
jgi:hypothetical protein